ncbi:uncharacterized protein LOC108046817 [Drosophila rhopaloa]|uniref:Uncharacterized protein LOC108046817 n=1 Tax=Drosophila rhopaloa TaxID=1041015 RepID=A0A6P4EVS5_DRORH|nr:uncharacterized protein LOC108046817 [Drosophila rhopaloa]XP_016982227.1 uncharacterized protein LOC108046817 [Drosophila rhopaloa]
MNTACCKCGASPNSLPYCLGGAAYEFHCFCCNKPPPMKCIQCGAPGNIELHMKHENCVVGKRHTFIFSEQWPPFPPTGAEATHTPPPDLQESDGHDLVIMSPRTLVEQPHQDDEPEDVIDVEDLTQRDVEFEEEHVDRKPLRNRDARWVTVQDIRLWPYCPRCRKLRTTRTGWIKHAQKCGQDPSLKKPKFFIYTHTKGWCDYLVRDSQWENHSNPTTGQCVTCSASRRQSIPLPFMPEPPPRPNESHLAKMRQRSRRLRKQKIRERLSSTF